METSQIYFIVQIFTIDQSFNVLLHYRHKLVRQATKANKQTTNEKKNLTSHLTVRIIFQSANPVNGPFCSLVRPCTVNIEQPALSSIFA